ncbi:MAG: hypothetical protein IJX38_04630 [Clostridia bacterium]|nr:hypothetical protein [Clostridia bacterium]
MTGSPSVSRHKRHYFKILLGLGFLIFPALNLIDIFPDCIAYFALAYAIGAAEELIPYVAETRSTLMKLGFLTLARIPAMLVMYANMAFGRDIVVLFTFVFNVAEVTLLIFALRSGFEAIYYLGERTDASALVRPIRLFGKQLRVEHIRSISIIYVIARGALNTIPSFFLMTFDNEWEVYFARMLYAPVELSFMAISLIMGIAWYIIIRKYIRTVKRQRTVYSSVRGMSGEERFILARQRREAKSRMSTLIILAASSLLTFELSFDNLNGVNILPHFIHGILLLYCAFRLFDGRNVKRLFVLSGGGYILFGFIAYMCSISFLDNFTYDDLARGAYAPEYEKAIKAYIPLEIFTVLETMFFLGFILLFALCFADLIRRHTLVDPQSDRYGIAERQYHKKQTVLAYVLFGITGLISLCKCLNVFFHARVERVFVYVEGEVGSAAVVAEPMLPWFGTLIFTLSLALVFFSFIYLMSVREDIKMKYLSEPNI